MRVLGKFTYDNVFTEIINAFMNRFENDDFLKELES